MGFSLIRWFLIGFLLYLLYRVIRSSWIRTPRRRRKKPGDGTVEDMVKDPVCGTYIPKSQAVTIKEGTTTVYFCSQKCADAYRQKPG